jgi:hypothetical protein
MKKPVSLIFCCLISLCCIAQHITAADEQELQTKEDSLQIYSSQMLDADFPQQKFAADSIFTRMFVKALKLHNSFFYPFDSLQTISKLYAPDSSFRIFTWQLALDENIVFQHGAIQMRTDDGSLKLFPLIDEKNIINNIADTVADNKSWVGAVYYKIVETKDAGRNYYTLIGYDEDNIRCNRKIIDVLTFDDDKKPVFGGPYFIFEKSLVERAPIARYVIEYKKDAAPKLNYDENMGMIIVEHLESETGEPNKKWTLIPDGDYEGFKWEGGKWIHIDKVFTQITPEGQEPVPNPVKDNNGNLLEDKLNTAAPAVKPKNN